MCPGSHQAGELEASITIDEVGEFGLIAAITAAMNTYRRSVSDSDAAALAAGRRAIEDLAGAALR